MKTGSADLPLHGGHCPPGLFEDMKDLAEIIVEAMLLEFDRDEVLRRFADPGWFQAFGCTLGFDWHSSGLTTVVCGALKEALNPRSGELGLYVAGGKGAASRKTPKELETFAEQDAPDLAVDQLKDCSRRAAQVDSSALQDGYQLYHHVFLVDGENHWTVIQQGIEDESGWARRYHWWNETVQDFLDDPHEGVHSASVSDVLNLATEESQANRDVSVKMGREDPVGTLQEYTKLLDFWDDTRRKLTLPDRHSLPNKSHMEKALGKLYDRPPSDFLDLMDRENIGSKTIRALSMVSEVVWGTEPSYEDPARYSFAHGGKDGYPRPVDKNQYRETIDILSDAIRASKLGDDTKLDAFKRLKSAYTDPPVSSGRAEKKIIEGHDRDTDQVDDKDDHPQQRSFNF